jgi:hypothetical protein
VLVVVGAEVAAGGEAAERTRNSSCLWLVCWRWWRDVVASARGLGGGGCWCVDVGGVMLLQAQWAWEGGWLLVCWRCVSATMVGGGYGVPGRVAVGGSGVCCSGGLLCLYGSTRMRRLRAAGLVGAAASGVRGTALLVLVLFAAVRGGRW